MTRLRIFPLSSLIFAVCVCTSILLGLNPVSLDFFSANSASVSSGWASSVHITTNASALVRLDSLLAKLVDSVGKGATSLESVPFGNTLPSMLYLTYYATGATGLVLLLYLVCGSICLALSIAVATTTILLSLFQYDLLVAGSFCWFPALISIIALALRNQCQFLIKLGLCSYFAYRLCQAGGYSALLLNPLALTFAYIVIPNNQESRKRLRPVLMAIAIPTLYLACTAPLPTLPDYSAFDHVVPDDGIEGTIYPLVTTAYAIPNIDRIFLREALAGITLYISMAWGFLALVAFRNKNKLLSYAALISGLVLVWDIFPREDFVHIGPVATIARLVPFQLFSPLIVSLLAASITLLPTLLISVISSTVQRSVLACCLAAIPLLLPKYPVLTRPDAASARNDYLQKKSLGELDTPTQIRFEKALLSPSYPVINHYGLASLNDPRIITEADFRAAKKFSAIANASSSGGTDGVDGLLKTRAGARWYTGKGPMQGSEWVHVYLPTPVKLRGVKLSADEFHTDFPRGLRIATLPSCNQPAKDFAPDVTLYNEQINEPSWQGSLGFTKSGHPYLTPQGVVKAYFRYDVTTQCLLIQQTGKSDFFDWSIANLQLLASDIVIAESVVTQSQDVSRQQTRKILP
jgi:hypothetical protein